MTGLVLKLKPFEKFLVNGVVLQNGDRSARIRVRTSGAAVLRIRDALHPEQAVTAARRMYYIAQLAVAGSSSEEEAQATIIETLPALFSSFRSEEAQILLAQAQKAAEEGKLFGVMRAMKKLFPIEDAQLRSIPDQSCFAQHSP